MQGSVFIDICTVRVGIPLDIEIYIFKEIIKSKHVIQLNIAKIFFYLPATDQAKKIIGAL